jgi:hypothetical protein
MDLEHTSLMPRLSLENPANAGFDLTSWLLRGWESAALRTVMVGGQKVYHLGAWQHVRESQLASWLAESDASGGGLISPSASSIASSRI